jgi:copper chaperone CopZ
MHTQTLHISGMTCGGCVATVQRLLLTVRDTVSAEIDLKSATAVLRTERAIPSAEFVQALAGHTKYAITSEKQENTTAQTITLELPILNATAIVSEQTTLDEIPRSWWQTYKPVLLIFAVVSVVSLLVSIDNTGFALMTFLRVFMAGFFLVFSFFKLLDVQAFAESYAMYDIVVDIFPVAMNWITLIIMSVSILGVLQQVLNKRAIRCACLGTVFQLPMSTITIIEDGLMIAMSVLMIILHS